MVYAAFDLLFHSLFRGVLFCADEKVLSRFTAFDSDCRSSIALKLASYKVELG